MKTLTITVAKKQLPELLQSQEPVTITRRGELLGVLSIRFTVKPAATSQRIRLAARRARKLAAKTPTVNNPEQGITAQIRRWRDSGESA